MSDADFDPTPLSTLREQAGESLARRVVQLFASQAPSLVDAVAEAWRDGRFVEAHRAAHTLKSNAATVGGRAARRLAAAIEHDAVVEVSYQPARVEALRRAVEATVGEAEALLVVD